MLVGKGMMLGRALGRGLLQDSCRWSHSAALPAPLERAMVVHGSQSTSFPVPETRFPSWRSKEEENEVPSHLRYFGVGALELMAVPKKKVSRHKRGLRNGPKALKPVPVIVRCKSCGRVKLPHFYCCSGDRGSSEGKNPEA